jgi:predicted transcriptional regulator
LSGEQRLKLEIIRSLREPCDRSTYGQRLKEAAKKLGKSERTVRRLIKAWENEGLAALSQSPRADKRQPRKSEYWYNLAVKTYKVGNKGSDRMTRNQVAETVKTKAYELAKQELQPEIEQLVDRGLRGEELDWEIAKLIESRTRMYELAKQELQLDIERLIDRSLKGEERNREITKLIVSRGRVQGFHFWITHGQPPSNRTVERWLKPIEEKQYQAKTSRSPGWHGSGLVLRTREGRELKVTDSNQVWQIDHTKADILLVDEDGEEIGRPQLTTVIDCHSRCIVGFRLGFSAPSSQVVALALRNAILPKRYGAEYELRSKWFYTFRNRASNQPNQSPVVPILYIELRGSSCSPTLLFENILKTLKHKATGGNENQLRKRAWDKLRQCKVEALIIDEAHRLQFKTLPDVTDLQKELGILPILIGTSNRLDTLISKNEQVASRFACYFNFEELSGNNFRKTVKIWEEQILMLPDSSNLATNEEVISLLQEKTSGQLRLLDQILRNAAIKALESGLTKIDKSVLDSIEGDYSLVAS